VSAAFGADGADVIFTSGATEAAALGCRGRGFASSRIEHDAVLGWTDGALAADAQGAVACAAPERTALQLANSETGIVQEMGRRSGTENIIGIAGFGAAAAAAAQDLADEKWARVEKLRNILENAIAERANHPIFVGKGARRLPNTSCIVTPGWKGETQVMQMDLAGFAISAGSACSSGKVRASGVLTAMGFDETAASSAIRVSLGLETTQEQVLAFADAWLAAYERHRARAA